MNKSCQHLIFFDDQCNLCRNSVRWVLSIDKTEMFCFSALDGVTSNEMLSGKYAYLQKENTLVLVEHFQSAHRRFWIRSRAVFKICWLIGGKWKILGIFFFFPSFIGDFIYRRIANHRHLFNKKKHRLFDSVEKKRLLP